MTEEEAKTKWCPFARSHVSATITRDRNPFQVAMTAVNRVENTDSPPQYTFCLGSFCMAWRWEVFPGAEEEYRFLFQGEDRPPPGEGWLRTERGWSRKKTPEGFCGLAGKI
jgi:hypothetical protein